MKKYVQPYEYISSTYASVRPWYAVALCRRPVCLFVRSVRLLPVCEHILKTNEQGLMPTGVRLDDHTPAHRALSQVAAARTDHRFGPGWRRQPGRPRHSWIQQIGDGTPFSIRAEWSKARRRGHSGLTQQTSAVYAI